MSSIHYFVIAALSAGCVSGNNAAPEQTSTVASSIVTLDSSALTDIPGGTIPTSRLTLTAFNSPIIARGLIQTTESMTRLEATGTRATDDSRTWTLETDAKRGSLLVARKHDGGLPIRLDPVTLQRSAVERLASWGLPSTEIGIVHQRRASAVDDDAPDQPRVFAHKTFVFRQVLGVPVEAHRAVVTHALDGTFQRALIKWPALAASGHLLHTRLSRAEIERLALDALAREGVTDGAIALRWRYVATPTTTGEVVLRLSVAARVPSVSGIEADSEPRDIDVDVSPVQ